MSESITVTRVFDAPDQLVFDAFTQREHFAVWFGTDAVEVPLDTLVWEPVAGTPWSAVMVLPDGSTKNWVGTFVEVERPSRFVFTLTDNPDEPDNVLPVTIAFTPVDGGTEVSLTQPTPGFGPEGEAGLTAGYNAFFDTVEKVVATLR